MSAKSWGPFSSSQLTAIVIAGLLCVAIPGGLWAAATVQYSFVSLYDAKSKQVARLGTGGALKVTNGVGPLVVSDGSGPLTVDGTVMEGAPADIVRFSSFPAGACAKVVSAPATSGLIIKRLVVNTDIDASPGSGKDIGFYISAGGCSPLVAFLTPPGIGLTDIDLGPGFTIPAGSSLWSATEGSVGMYVFGTGYLVPAAALAAANAVTAQNAPPRSGAR